MFYCEKCRSYYDNGQIKIAYDKDSGCSNVCPCGSDQIVSAAECSICSKPFTTEDACFDDVCDDCMKAVCDSFEAWKKDNTSEQLEALDTIYDGENLYTEARETWYGKRLFGNKEEK